MDAQIEKVIKALESNNIKAYYAETRADVCEIVKNMLFKGAVIVSGGSVSLNESGVWDIINSPEYDFRDRFKEAFMRMQRMPAQMYTMSSVKAFTTALLCCTTASRCSLSSPCLQANIGTTSFAFLPTGIIFTALRKRSAGTQAHCSRKRKPCSV